MTASLAMYGIAPEQWDNLTIDTIKPAEPPPELPAEVWQSTEWNSDRAHAATLALCSGA